MPVRKRRVKALAFGDATVFPRHVGRHQYLEDEGPAAPCRVQAVLQTSFAPLNDNRLVLLTLMR